MIITSVRRLRDYMRRRILWLAGHPCSPPPGIMPSIHAQRRSCKPTRSVAVFVPCTKTTWPLYKTCTLLLLLTIIVIIITLYYAKRQHNCYKCSTIVKTVKKRKILSPGKTAINGTLMTFDYFGNCCCQTIQWYWRRLWTHLMQLQHVTCDVGYLCANFGLPRPLCSQFRPDVRDRYTDTKDVRQKHRLMPLAYGGGGEGIIG